MYTEKHACFNVVSGATIYYYYHTYTGTDIHNPHRHSPHTHMI